MLRFNKKVEYAIIALMEMVNRLDNTQLVTARSLADQHQIPQELMGKVLQTLTRHGLLNSVQGVKGGYTLAQNPENINLWNVVEAIEGNVYVVQCLSPGLGCEQFERCNIRQPMEIIQEQLMEYLKGITLKDIHEMQQSAITLQG